MREHNKPKKKFDRELNSNEYWSFKNNHKYCKSAFEKYEKEIRSDKMLGLISQKQIKKKVKKAVQTDSFDEIDDLLYEENRVIAKTYNVRNDQARQKMIEEYEVKDLENS